MFLFRILENAGVYFANVDELNLNGFEPLSIPSIFRAAILSY